MKQLLLTISTVILLALPVAAADAQTSGNDFPLDVVWEADTYTPASYSGKALPAPASRVRLVALTPTQNPAALSFSWSVQDGSSFAATADLEGRGENEFKLFTERLIPNFTHTIDITVRNVFTGAESSAHVELPLQSPQVHLQSQGVGIADSLSLPVGSTTEVRALPLYFSVERLDDLLFSWRVVGQRAASAGAEDVLNIRINPETPSALRQSFSVVVENKTRGRQTAQAEGLFIITQ